MRERKVHGPCCTALHVLPCLEVFGGRSHTAAPVAGPASAAPYAVLLLLLLRLLLLLLLLPHLLLLLLLLLWTGVQPYVINGAKVLFLRSRPQPRAPKSNGGGIQSGCVLRCVSCV